MLYRNRVLLGFLTMILPLCVNAQSEKNKNSKPVVAATKMNTLFEGIENPLSVAVPGYPCKNIIVTCSNGILTGKDCEYIIIPNEVGLAVIKVVTVQKRDTILLGETEFRVKRVPLPQPMFCIYRGIITKNQAATCLGLRLYYEGFEYIPPFKITQFDLVINRTFRLSANQSMFTDEMKDALKKVKTGDIIEFEKIKANAYEAKPNKIVDIEDLKLRVEE